MMWNCPRCQSTNLKVVAQLSLVLIQDQDNFETVDEGSDHEWDANSPMICQACGHAGPAHTFDLDRMLPPGTRVLSIDGEMSDTDDGQDVSTGTMAVGRIDQVLPDQENCYSVSFDNGVSILLSRTEITGPGYIVANGIILDEPAPWTVQINRLGYGSRVINVKARFSGEAELLALEVAGDYEYPEVGADYEVDHAKCLDKGILG